MPCMLILVIRKGGYTGIGGLAEGWSFTPMRIVAIVGKPTISGFSLHSLLLTPWNP